MPSRHETEAEAALVRAQESIDSRRVPSPQKTEDRRSRGDFRIKPPSPEAEARRAAWERRQAAREALEREQNRPEVKIAAAREGLDPWLKRSNVGLRHRRIDWDLGLIPPALREWVEGETLDGAALLAGPVSTGKSASAVWVLRERYLRGIGDDPPRKYKGPTALYITTRKLIAAVFDRDRKLIDRCEKIDLLVIDDMGAAYEHAWPLSDVDGIVDERWLACLPTVMTTNLLVDKRPNEDSFEARYPRAHARLTDRVGPGLVVMAGRNLRR